VSRTAHQPVSFTHNWQIGDYPDTWATLDLARIVFARQEQDNDYPAYRHCRNGGNRPFYCRIRRTGCSTGAHRFQEHGQARNDGQKDGL
jgi:hypothetical protein